VVLNVTGTLDEHVTPRSVPGQLLDPVSERAWGFDSPSRAAPDLRIAMAATAGLTRSVQ